MLNIFLGAIFVAIPAYVIYCCVRVIRSRRNDPDSYNPTFMYGAWQGHSLGTTYLEPGQLTRIENKLMKAGMEDEGEEETVEASAEDEEPGEESPEPSDEATEAERLPER